MSLSGIEWDSVIVLVFDTDFFNAGNCILFGINKTTCAFGFLFQQVYGIVENLVTKS